MIKNGIVKQLDGESAEVEIIRSSACGDSCASCGICSGRAAMINALNPVGAKAGDSVAVDMSDNKVLSAAFLVYIVPVIMLIIGYFIGTALFEGELRAIVSGFCLMAVSFFVTALLDKRLRRLYTHKIVKIL